jgi:hypothetical protein
MQRVKYLSVAASLAAVADAQTPSQFTLTVDNLLPTVATTIQGQALNMSIDNNANNNFAFGSSCMQKVGLATEVACSAAPTLVSASVDDQLLTGVGANYFNLVQGGFTTDGRKVNGTVELELLGGSTVNSTQVTYVAETITQDAWNYNIATGAGSVAMGMNSTTMLAQTVHSFLLETGPVTDQTFAGGKAPLATPVLAVGAGDYSTLFNATSP